MNCSKYIYSFSLCLFLLIACNPASDPAEEQSEVAPDSLIALDDEKGITTSSEKLMQLDSPFQYTYRWLQEPGELMPNVPSVEKPAVSPADVVEETIGQLTNPDNAPPLFKANCISEADPIQCSTDSLQVFFERYKSQTKDDYEGWIIAHLLIDKDGIPQLDTLRGVNISLDDKKEMVRNMIAEMPNWSPAKRRGKVEEVEVFLPIQW